MGLQQYHETGINVEATDMGAHEFGQQQYYETGISVKDTELGTRNKG